MAYVPDDPDEQDCMDSMPDVDAQTDGNLKAEGIQTKAQEGDCKQPPRCRCKWQYRTPSNAYKEGLLYRILMPIISVTERVHTDFKGGDAVGRRQY